MQISQITFNGQFKYDKMKPKQAKALNSILTTKINGISNEELLKEMPFDVDVYCTNPTKKAINPRFNFFIKHTEKGVPLFGFIQLNSKNPPEENVSKLGKFIISAKEKTDSITGNEKLTPAEELLQQLKFIYNNYS